MAAVAAVLLVGALLFFVRRPPTGAPPEAPVAAAPQPAAPTGTPADVRPSAGGGTPDRPRASRTPASTEAAPEAPPAAEPVADIGTLRIETDVPGAQVFIDRQFVGTAPLTAVNVKPGTHQLNVSAEGFDGIARTIDVEPGPAQ